MSFPSIGRSGSFAPIAFATVGRMSMVQVISEQVDLAGILAGQRAIIGTRIPPSQQVPFPSRSGPAVPQ